MAIGVLIQELRELIVQNLEEHPVLTYFGVFLGGLVLLFILYQVYTAILSALYSLA